MIFTPKNTLKTCLVSSLLLLTLFGCDSSDDSSGVGYVKLYNLSEDSPIIYLTVDEDLSSDSDDDDHYESTYTGVGYGTAHSNSELDTAIYEYQLAWQDDDSTDVDDLEIIYEDTFTVTDDTIHMLVLNNSVLTPQVTVFNIPVIDDDDDTDNDLFNLRILNMHTNEQPIDVYRSKDDETFNEASLVSQSSYLQLSDNQKVDQGDYIFYITAAGSDEVLFTSSSIPFYYSSQNIMIVRKNTGAGSSSYVLDKMSDSSVIEYVDFESEAQFRAYNAVANHEKLPEYEEDFSLHINGVSDTPIIDSLAFGEVSEALLLESSNYSLDLTYTADYTPLLSNHLLSLLENTNKTIFFYAEEEYIDKDGDGDIDEDGNGEIDEIEVGIFSLIVENSSLTGIYSHEIEVVNLIQSDDFAQVAVYFVRQDEIIETALYNSYVNYKSSGSLTLTNNTYQVFVLADDNGSVIILNSFELILDEESTEQFLVLEVDNNAPTGYKTTIFSQTPVQE